MVMIVQCHGQGCSWCIFGVVHVAFVGLLLVVALVVLLVLGLLAVLLLVPSKLCNVAGCLLRRRRPRIGFHLIQKLRLAVLSPTV